MESRRVLVLGISGMLGHKLFEFLHSRQDLGVFGTVRNIADLPEGYLDEKMRTSVSKGVDANEYSSLERAIRDCSPDVVVNCIGLVKQSRLCNEPLSAIYINSLLPHKIANTCASIGARMVHISTDCVFDGEKGGYTEDDSPTAKDLYGRTKYLGEVAYEHCTTLRTSIIGHELKKKHGLIEWFLSQARDATGYAAAFFSGFPTIELARTIEESVIRSDGLSGLYHVSADPITKFDLLHLVAKTYGKSIMIKRDTEFRCDRSLISTKFRTITSYSPRSWPRLIELMHIDFEKSSYYQYRT